MPVSGEREGPAPSRRLRAWDSDHAGLGTSGRRSSTLPASAGLGHHGHVALGRVVGRVVDPGAPASHLWRGRDKEGMWATGGPGTGTCAPVAVVTRAVLGRLPGPASLRGAARLPGPPLRVSAPPSAAPASPRTPGPDTGATVTPRSRLLEALPRDERRAARSRETALRGREGQRNPRARPHTLAHAHQPHVYSRARCLPSTSCVPGTVLGTGVSGGRRHGRAVPDRGWGSRAWAGGGGGRMGCEVMGRPR